MATPVWRRRRGLLRAPDRPKQAISVAVSNPGSKCGAVLVLQPTSLFQYFSTLLRFNIATLPDFYPGEQFFLGGLRPPKPRAALTRMGESGRFAIRYFRALGRVVGTIVVPAPDQRKFEQCSLIRV